MSTYILGISSYYHDSAAALLKDGKIVAAAQEERFTRKKHDPSFPVNSINYCLEEAEIEIESVDHVAYYDNPFLTLNRVFDEFQSNIEMDEDKFKKSIESIVAQKFWIKRDIKEHFKYEPKDARVIFCGHHMSHAASAFYPSPFNEAAILTVDGVGESTTTSICHGKGNTIEILREIHYPHSLGLLYSAFTYFCGFKVNSGEYKLMGLAPYGEPIYADLIESFLIDCKDDGSFELNMSYFEYQNKGVMTGAEFEELFQIKRRQPESKITKEYLDIAASVQVVTEKIMLGLVKHAIQLTKCKNVVLAGGVALNCVANGKISQIQQLEGLWIQPASGDAGGALGACLITHYQLLKNPRSNIVKSSVDGQLGSLLGPSFSEEEIVAALDRYNLEFYRYDNSRLRNERLTELLQSELVIGHFNGRMEFGPRALGNRSIIADARSEKMQKKLNLKIKYRESFRPFAPIVLEEDAQKYFDLRFESPYMLIVAPVKKDLRKSKLIIEDNDNLIEVINEVRSTIPAVTHVDYSARVQTVDKTRNSVLYELLKVFKEKTGSSVLVNTSFNVRGEPIVCSPQDAIQCFLRTEMDVLALNNFIIVKSENSITEVTKDWMNEYELD